jgi:hypothetical protein
MSDSRTNTEQASVMEHPFTGDPCGRCTVCLRPVDHWVHRVPPDPNAEPPEGPRTEPSASLNDARSDDGLEYVRDYYGVPAVIGRRVEADGREGVITGGDGQYLLVRIAGENAPSRWHPMWRMHYFIEASETSGGEPRDS